MPVFPPNVMWFPAEVTSIDEYKDILMIVTPDLYVNS